MSEQSKILKKALKAKGMSAAELSRQMGIHSSYVYQVLQGMKDFTKPETIDAAAAVLGINGDDLYAATGKVPHDVVDGLFQHPILLPVVRTLIRKVTDQATTEEAP